MNHILQFEVSAKEAKTAQTYTSTSGQMNPYKIVQWDQQTEITPKYVRRLMKNGNISTVVCKGNITLYGQKLQEGYCFLLKSRAQ